MTLSVYGSGSVNITGASFDRVCEFTSDELNWFLDPQGAPVSHPSLTGDHVLIAQLGSANEADQSTLHVVYDFPTMRLLYSQALAQGSDIHWSHANVYQTHL